jgi:hypothetical protein
MPTTATNVTRAESERDFPYRDAMKSEMVVIRFSLRYRRSSGGRSTRNRHERGPIDRKEAQARVRRFAHAAIERPGGAVHGERERIDIGVRYETLPLPFLAFREISREEQEEKIGKYDRQQYPGRKHLASAVFPFGKDRSDKDTDDKDEPDDEQRKDQAALKNTHDRPAEKKSSEDE